MEEADWFSDLARAGSGRCMMGGGGDGMWWPLKFGRAAGKVGPRRDRRNEEEGYVSTLKKDEKAGTRELRSSGVGRWSLSDRGSRDLPRFITP